MPRVPHAEKMLVCFPPDYRHEDVDPKEMDRGRQEGRRRRETFLLLLLSLIKSIDTSSILIWIQSKESSHCCQHHNEFYFPWSRIHDNVDTTPILIPKVESNSLPGGLVQEVKTQVEPQGQQSMHDATLGRLSSTSGSQLGVILSRRGPCQCLETKELLSQLGGPLEAPRG